MPKHHAKHEEMKEASHHKKEKKSSHKEMAIPAKIGHKKKK